MFEHTYLINIEKRKDRLENSLKECEKIGITPEIFPAITPYKDMKWIPNDSPEIWNKNSAALVHSTIAIIKDAIKNKYENILILEDDVVFRNNSKQVIDNFKFPIDPTWAMIHFGTMDEVKPITIDSKFTRLKKSYCCHMYAINSLVYEDYLYYLEQVNQPIDWITAYIFQPFGKCFGLIDPIAFQKPNYSNIREKEVNYTTINI